MKGRPKKENSKEKQFNVRLTNDENDMLDELSGRTGKSKSDVIRCALNLYNRMTATTNGYKEI